MLCLINESALKSGGAMQIQTSRFGLVDIDKEDLVTFQEGLLGFNHLRTFVFLDDPNDEIFAWLQSCENPAIAFPILEPELFIENYGIKLSKGDLQALSLAEAKGYRAFTIVTIPDDPTLMTANLKAPIIVNVKARLARQCVLQDNKLAICEPIFSSLKQRVVQNPQVSIKDQVGSMEIAIKLPQGPGSEPEATK